MSVLFKVSELQATMKVQNCNHLHVYCICMYQGDSLRRDAKNLKWRPIQKYPNASKRDLSELITEISDPRSVHLQTFLMVARLSPLTLSVSEASYRQVKNQIYSFTFHISLLSARLAPHSKQLQRRESHQTIRSCPKNCTDPTPRNVQVHLVSVNRCQAIPRTASHNAMLFRSRVYM